MLLASDRSVQWAAIRAISQIGGEGSSPAVKFMLDELPTASHVEQYNMMIYFALLGSDAREASSTLRDFRAMMNPMLKPATLWAIDPEANFPWVMNMGFPFGGPGGPSGPQFANAPAGQGGAKESNEKGDVNRVATAPVSAPGTPNGPGSPGAGFRGPPMGMGDGPDLARYIFEAYFIELGERLTPSVRKLANTILDGREGNIPTWGYKLLNCAPAEAVKILAPNLKDESLAKRERAAVALGYMRQSAESAHEQVQKALAAAANEQEKRLMQWCLREIESTDD
jgi:HEAT repeat protein